MKQIDKKQLMKENKGLMLVSATIGKLVKKQSELIEWVNKHEKEKPHN